MSDEDVLPQWLRRLILDGLPDTDPNRFPRIKYSVCTACNDVLNERFEKPARDLVTKMIRGEFLALTPTDCAIVSRWMVKTDLLVATLRRYRGQTFYAPGAMPTSEANSIEKFRLLLQPLVFEDTMPAETVVAAGRVDMTLERPTHELPNRIRHHGWLYSVTRWPELIYETSVFDARHRGHARRRRSDPRTMVLHPTPETSIEWPPAPMSLSESDTMGLRYRRGEWMNPIQPRRDAGGSKR